MTVYKDLERQNREIVDCRGTRSYLNREYVDLERTVFRPDRRTVRIVDYEDSICRIQYGDTVPHGACAEYGGLFSPGASWEREGSEAVRTPCRAVPQFPVGPHRMGRYVLPGEEHVDLENPKHAR